MNEKIIRGTKIKEKASGNSLRITGISVIFDKGDMQVTLSVTAEGTIHKAFPVVMRNSQSYSIGFDQVHAAYAAGLISILKGRSKKS